MKRHAELTRLGKIGGLALVDEREDYRIAPRGLSRRKGQCIVAAELDTLICALYQCCTTFLEPDIDIVEGDGLRSKDIGERYWGEADIAFCKCPLMTQSGHRAAFGTCLKLNIPNRPGGTRDLAESLQQQTATADVLKVTAARHLAVEDAVSVEPVGDFALKGISRPVAAYNVLSALSAKI